MSLNAEEHYRVHGNLPAPMIEALLDAAIIAEAVGDAEVYISEANCQFTEEDFLHDRLSELQALAKSMRRSDNKETLLQIIEDLENDLSVQRGASEEGRDNLKKATAAINGKVS